METQWWQRNWPGLNNWLDCLTYIHPPTFNVSYIINTSAIGGQLLLSSQNNWLNNWLDCLTYIHPPTFNFSYFINISAFGGQLLLSSNNSKVQPELGSEKACTASLETGNVFPSATWVQSWLLITLFGRPVGKL